MHTGAEIDLKLKKTMKLKTIKEMTAVVVLCTACKGGKTKRVNMWSV